MNAGIFQEGCKLSKKIATMATYPGGAETFKEACQSILPQVDMLYIYFNEYSNDDVPSWVKRDSKITYEVSEPLLRENLGDVGKFYFLFNQNHEDYPLKGYIFLCDDDIVYPEWYTERVSDLLRSEEFSGSIVSYHGYIFKKNFTDFTKDRHVFHFAGTVDTSSRVDVGGTGCMSFDSTTLQILREDFPHTNMSDIFIAKKAAKNEVPIYVLPHESGDFKALHKKQTIFASTKSQDHTDRNRLCETQKEVLDGKWLLT